MAVLEKTSCSMQLNTMMMDSLDDPLKLQNQLLYVFWRKWLKFGMQVDFSYQESAVFLTIADQYWQHLSEEELENANSHLAQGNNNRLLIECSFSAI